MPYRSTFVYIKHLHAPDPFVLGPVQTQAGLHKMYSLTSPLKDSLVSVTLGEKKKGGGGSDQSFQEALATQFSSEFCVTCLACSLVILFNLSVCHYNSSEHGCILCEGP